ncbi:MAG: hypothetical protein HC929_19070 [Leptolyngbyaceae cyanobacterium SM2_5_2]|nr:hypothetical protein [Leptolyngbyaceae cyanobacterium SM2_5_2]
MKHALLSSVLLLSFGITACGTNNQVSASLPEAEQPSQPTAETAPVQEPPAVAQVEPNQDSLQMTCPGSIQVNDVDFTVFFTREAGFSRIQLRRRSTGQQIAEAFLSYDRKNDKGQAIWRGAVNDAADVTLVHLSTRPAQRGDQVSVGYDRQWGRGTCR